MTRRRYTCDTTAAEWALIEPLLPVPACRTTAGGRPEKHHRRDIVDAIRYVTDNGCKWRALPHDYGVPWQTVYGFFARWARASVLTRIRDALREMVRARAGRCPRPVTAILDSQTVKAAETVAKDQRGYDAAKKINGRKRHVAVDTQCLPLLVMVTPADRPDRDLLARLRILHPQLALAWADSAYAGTLIAWADRFLHLTLKTVRRPIGQKGFVVLPRRWIVERTLGWFMRARRNAQRVSVKRLLNANAYRGRPSRRCCSRSAASQPGTTPWRSRHAASRHRGEQYCASERLRTPTGHDRPHTGHRATGRSARISAPVGPRAAPASTSRANAASYSARARRPSRHA
ncbi:MULTISPECIES: IS5 family transposase [Actinomadura]|uniref:IS5 family transposase n=1 Tax=Actinomadura yumaensis TaxID=111807 RepID=A0ABW2CCU9_9ACTN|nr:IS5 family transposase [Actinomadura sp. J1-007]